MSDIKIREHLEKHLKDKLSCIELLTDASDALIDCDFAVYESDGKTVIYAPLASFFEEALSKYLAEGEFGRVAYYTTDKVYYSDFGAVGDGKNKDVNALKSAHSYANMRNRHTVCANAGCKYYIEKMDAKPIEIATSCDFSDAEFIIDDRFITEDEELKADRYANVFRVLPEKVIICTKEQDTNSIMARINASGGIGVDDEKLPLDLGFDSIVAVINSEHSMYHRWDPSGKSGNGAPQQEIMVIRADNTVDMSAKLLFPYVSVDKLIISKCDTAPITLKGGRFVTIATRTDIHWGGVNRNFQIERSNVTIDGMDHYVDNQPLGEPIKKKLTGYERLIPVSSGGGPNYVNGWINTYMTNNVLIKNTKLCGHVHYNNGSYDIGGKLSNKTVFKNCNQYNMYDENGKVYSEIYAYWGIHGTNYCKNIEFTDCEFSRFDAHAGVYNVKISGCKLGKINAVGGGTLTIEDTTVFCYSGVGLRQDYASSWMGDIIFKNVILDTQGDETDEARLVSGNIHNTFFGFYSKIPNITVDNVSWRGGISRLSVYGIDSDDSFYDESAEKLNKIIPAEYLKIKNQKTGFEIERISIFNKCPLYKKLIKQ
jgi:hypothetical protein